MNPFGDNINSLPTNEILDYNLMVGHKSGSAEDYMYPAYLSDEGDPQTALCNMLDNLQLKTIDDILEDEPVIDKDKENKEGEVEEIKDEANETMLKAEEAVWAETWSNFGTSLPLFVSYSSISA